MTTIAYRDGVLAADSSVTCYGRYEGETRKLWRGDGFIAGISGRAAMINFLKTIRIENGFPVSDVKLGSDDEVLIVCGDRVFFGGEIGFFEMKHDFYVGGSGGSIALGAMAAGATAEEAVQIACKYDTSSAEPIHTMRINA